MSTLFFRNPRLLALTICLILVAGLSSFSLMPRMEDPELTQRFATIRTLYPGASPERVESLITEPIEEELDKLEEIKLIESRSNAEISIIQVELKDDIYDIEPVWSKVRDKLNDVTPRLPADAMAPRYEEVFPRAYAMIIGLKWLKSEEPNYAILKRMSEILEEKLRAIPGTEETKVYGDPQEEILVELDATRAATTHLSPQLISNLIRESDAKVSGGQLRSSTQNYLMELDTELDSVKRVSSIPVASGNDGEVVPLGDLALVTKSFKQPISDIAILDGTPAVAIGVLIESKYRVDLWAEKVRALLAEYQQTLPAGIEAELIFDQSVYTTTRLRNLLWEFVFGSVAVLLVIVLMMGWKEAILVSTALPLTSLVVLAGLHFLGIPLHQMSITGLIIASGLLIDNAIIAVDEIRIRIEEGYSPIDAVKRTVDFLFLPLFGSTITTVLSFAPIALMPGAAGEFVGTIAIGVILALICSLFISLTITLTLAAWSINVEHVHNEIWLDRIIKQTSLPWLYEQSLVFTMHRPLTTSILCLTIPVAGFLTMTVLEEQFFPPSDRDQFQVRVELPVQTSIAETRRVVEEVRQHMLTYPEVTHVHFFLGRSAPIFYYNMVETRENSPNFAQAMIQLKSPRGYFDLIRRVQRSLDETFPHALCKATQLEQGPPFDAAVEVKIYGHDLNRLRVLGEEVRQVLSDTPGVVNTRSDLSIALPKLAWNVDEETAYLSGLSHIEIAQQLSGSLEGVTGGSVFEGTEELPVRVRLKQDQRGNLGQLHSFDMPLAGMQSTESVVVPLKSFAEVDLTSEISSIPRLNRQRVNIVQATVTAGTLPQETLNRFLSRWDPSTITDMPGYTYAIGGEAEKRDDAVGNLFSTVGILGVCMVAALVLSLGSFRLSMLIGMIGMMSAGYAIGSLYLFGYPFGFMAIVGVMGQIGVAINDSICVLCAIMDDPQARVGNRQAMIDITKRCTRHVLATTFTTIVSSVPLVYGGGGQWPPLAIAIAGGVIGATALALYFVPPMYLLLKGYAWQQSPDVAKENEIDSLHLAEHDLAQTHIPAFN